MQHDADVDVDFINLLFILFTFAIEIDVDFVSVIQFWLCHILLLLCYFIQCFDGAGWAIEHSACKILLHKC